MVINLIVYGIKINHLGDSFPTLAVCDHFRSGNPVYVGNMTNISNLYVPSFKMADSVSFELFTVEKQMEKLCHVCKRVSENGIGCIVCNNWAHLYCVGTVTPLDGGGKLIYMCRYCKNGVKEDVVKEQNCAWCEGTCHLQDYMTKVAVAYPPMPN